MFGCSKEPQGGWHCAPPLCGLQNEKLDKLPLYINNLTSGISLQQWKCMKPNGLG